MIISDKDPATMWGSEITKEQASLEKISSRLNDRMLADGRGDERPSERCLKSDALSQEINAVEDRLWALRQEVQLRAGPGYYHLMRGVGGKPRRVEK